MQLSISSPLPHTRGMTRAQRNSMESDPGTREKPRHAALTHNTAEHWVITVKWGFLGLLPPTTSNLPRFSFHCAPKHLAISTHKPSRKPMPFIPNNPPALSLSRTQKEIVRNYNLGDLVPSATHEHNVPLYTVTEMVISKPFLMGSPPEEDELHLQHHYFFSCSNLPSTMKLPQFINYQHIYNHEMEDEMNKAVPLRHPKSRLLTCFTGGFAAPS